MKSMEDIMRAAQNVQEQMAASQAKLDEIEVEGQSGGGMVKVRASAKGRITGLDIDDSLIVPDDKEMLEDLIVAAVNDAIGKAREAAQEEMAKVTEGLPLPPGMKPPFG
ncbi:MAG: YbaB/EbfC family nucleoid-associated protein [Pseudomonadota bacterium]